MFLAGLQHQGLVQPAEDLALAVRERARQRRARRCWSWSITRGGSAAFARGAAQPGRAAAGAFAAGEEPSRRPCGSPAATAWGAGGLSPLLPPLLETSTMFIPGTLELAEWTDHGCKSRLATLAGGRGCTHRRAGPRSYGAGQRAERIGGACESVLPLLAATLERLWESLQLRPGATVLTAADYQGGAVLSRAPFASPPSRRGKGLPLRLQPMARRLLLLLLHPQPLTGSTLQFPAAAAGGRALLNQLAPGHLVPPSGSGQLAVDAPARLGGGCAFAPAQRRAVAARRRRHRGQRRPDRSASGS